MVRLCRAVITKRCEFLLFRIVNKSVPVGNTEIIHYSLLLIHSAKLKMLFFSQNLLQLISKYNIIGLSIIRDDARIVPYNGGKYYVRQNLQFCSRSVYASRSYSLINKRWYDELQGLKYERYGNEPPLKGLRRYQQRGWGSAPRGYGDSR